MKKHLFFISAALLLSGASIHSQEVRKASIQADGSITSKVIEVRTGNQPVAMNNDQMENFPVGFPANPTFKNSRGVTLEDIDGDGIHEIFHAADGMLYAIKDNGDMLWSKAIDGVATYPPTVVDLNGDGNYQVIQTTAGAPLNGRIYLVDALTGEDHTGWPLNFNNNMILSAASTADLTGNGIMDIVFSERISSTEGHVHAVDINGNPINENWPFVAPGTPAVTPSLGDINNDGTMDVVFAISSGSYYAVDSATGDPLPGFPKVFTDRGFSYQSPILVDLTGDENLEIVAANHGDVPGFFVLDHEGNMMDGWPHNIGGWTYTPPTVADIEGDGEYELFFSDRITGNDPSEEYQVIYAYNKEGDLIEDMSVTKYGGTEGVMTIADINNDGVMDIIFPSVLTEDDHGFIHAYSLDGSGQLDGFPKRPKGFTFMNGAVLGATEDNMLKLVANSHTTFTEADSTFVNVYEMNVPYDPDKILSNGYKGDNTRSGLVKADNTTATPDFDKLSITVYPNPSNGKVIVNSPIAIRRGTLQLIGLDGKLVYLDKDLNLMEGKNNFDFGSIQSGVYILTLSDGVSHFVERLIIK